MKKYILLILLLLLFSSNINAQIIYNQSKPISFKNTELTKINDLPTIKFTVDTNGNFSERDLNINIKQKARIEKYGNKNIARMKISLDVLSFGEITLRFSDINLTNNAHCYVYTNDYQIIAGPIYSTTIKNILNIVKIPAKEMIIEVVFNKSDDFNIILTSIAYQSVSKISKRIKKQKKLQAVGNYICPCETHNISYYNIIDSINYMPDKCQWLGYYTNNQLFSLSKLSSINDYNLDASRAACIIMIPNNYNSYDCRTGTLLNFPYDSCHSSFIFTTEHHSEIKKIIDTTIYLNSHPSDNDSKYFLNNTLIRFNWHHKYGTPFHLENIPCNSTNFTLWRQTIDFDEVIDYCGVRAFSYNEWKSFTIIKILHQPFYKEQHLGWTSQMYFNHSHTEDMYAPNDTMRSLNSEKFKIMGRKAFSPTSILNNYEVLFDTYNNNIQAVRISVRISNPDDNYPISALTMSGWSGSQVLYPNYDDSLQNIGIAIINYSSGDSIKKFLIADTYPSLFKYYVKFIDKPLYLAYNKNMYDNYLSNFANSLNWHYSQHDSLERWPTDTITYQDTCYWLSSLENKEKCPSEVGLADTCKFNINDYIATNGLCFNIDTIPENLFPNGDYPKGYRVYHNFADQKTLKFETFHSGNDITFPLEFCMDSCDLFYYMNKGMDTLDIAIDFYDEFGKIYNNIGCDTASFKFGINLNFCDFFHISLTDSCCENKITIKTVECDNASHLLFTMLDSLVFKNTTTNETTSLRDIDGITADYLNGEITFDYPFEDYGNCSIIANFNGETCASEEIEVKCEEE